MTATAGDLQQLRVILLKAAAGLELIEKKMFGCAALFTRGNIFALVWKHGRLAVKLPDPEAFDTLAKEEGAEPWTPGPQMAHWLLVPPTFHSSPDDLSQWVRRAHGLAQAAREAAAAQAAAPAKKPASKPAAKPAAKKPARSVPPPASKKTASKAKAAAKPVAKKRA